MGIDAVEGILLMKIGYVAFASRVHEKAVSGHGQLGHQRIARMMDREAANRFCRGNRSGRRVRGCLEELRHIRNGGNDCN